MALPAIRSGSVSVSAPCVPAYQRRIDHAQSPIHGSNHRRSDHRGGLRRRTQDTPAPSAPDSPPPAADAPSGAAALPELTESTTSNNGVTVRYPAGWEEPISTVGVFLYNNSGAQTALTLLRFREGQLAFQINAQPVSAQRSFEEAFNFFFGSLAAGVNITLSTAEAIRR
jgi:hypothetical protein